MAILVSDKKRWEKAIEKARATKPNVKALDFGKFKVCGSKGDRYIVTWTGKGEEMKAECDCKAGQQGKPCYHVPATSGIWKLQVKERAEARQVCPECGKETEGGVMCQDCANWVEELLFGRSL